MLQAAYRLQWSKRKFQKLRGLDVSSLAGPSSKAEVVFEVKSGWNWSFELVASHVPILAGAPAEAEWLKPIAGNSRQSACGPAHWKESCGIRMRNAYWFCDTVAVSSRWCAVTPCESSLRAEGVRLWTSWWPDNPDSVIGSVRRLCKTNRGGGKTHWLKNSIPHSGRRHWKATLPLDFNWTASAVELQTAEIKAQPKLTDFATPPPSPKTERASGDEPVQIGPSFRLTTRSPHLSFCSPTPQMKVTNHNLWPTCCRFWTTDDCILGYAQSFWYIQCTCTMWRILHQYWLNDYLFSMCH